MKKIIILLLLISLMLNWFLISKNIELDWNLLDNSFKNEKLEEEINLLKKENENILNKTYCTCKKWFNFWDICINKLDKEFIKNNLESNQWNWTYNLFLDFWLNDDLKKFKKILNILDKDYKKLKIQELRLSCVFNFDKEILSLLKKININKLFIDTEECWFYNWKNAYNKDLVLKFFKEAENIKELEIWYIITDKYKKENWEVKVYKEN